MARNNRKRRDRKSRITIDMTPEAIAARREAAEVSALERKAHERSEGRKPENWGAELTHNRLIGTETKTDRKGRVRGAWRSNPFTLLVQKGTLKDDQGNAGHDLLRIYAAAKGLEGAAEEKPYWKRTDDPLSWGAEDRKQYNIVLLAAIMAELSKPSRALAEALAYALIEEDRPVSWGGIVQATTGAATAQRQSERMVMLCEELVEAIPAARKAVKERNERKAA